MNRAGRLWHGLTFGVALVAVIWQFALTIQGHHWTPDANGLVPDVSTRLVRFFSYFTIESNIFVAVTSAVLLVKPRVSSLPWRVARVDAVFGIFITGVIYTLLLRNTGHLYGAQIVTNALLHYLSPVLVVVGWLAFGPRGRIDTATFRMSLIWPSLYVAYSFAHGAIAHWYPYDFIDVTTLGYAVVIRNAVVIYAFIAGVAGLMTWFDGRLPGARPE